MYQRDVPEITAHGLASPEGFRDVALFAILSIRKPISSMGLQMADVRTKGRRSAFLFGHKRDGFDYLVRNAARLHEAVCLNAGDPEGAMRALLQCPSLGLAKAGFVAQMLGFETACLDMWNLKALGLPPRAFREPFLPKLDAYLVEVQERGAEYWWNAWCEMVAAQGRMNKRLATADDVSRFHADVILDRLPQSGRIDAAL